MTVDTPDTSQSGTGWKSGKWRALLMASLALNFVFAGLAASTLWKKRVHTNSGSQRVEELGLQGFLRTLPRERAKELRALIKDEKPDLKPLNEATRQARRSAAETLAADPFDKDKLISAFANIDTTQANVKAAARAAVVAAAGHMTADERKALAARWKTRRARYFEGPAPPKDRDTPEDNATPLPTP
jgi:uncharacterized membrane protein